MRPAHYSTDITAFGADALFVSALQRSDAPGADQIRQVIDAAVRAFGYSGCAGRVAQEFGDHPETAAARMRWARETMTGLAFRLPLAATRCFRRRDPAGHPARAVP